MPRISSFNGIEVYMYFNDHMPPHFHAIYGDDEVIIDINSCTVYSGSLPAKQLKEVQAWAKRNKRNLQENWVLASSNQSLFRI